MVSVAVRNGKQLGLSVTGTVADAENLPFASQSVDLVVGHAVLHHVPDLDALFSEVIRILRPGGRFVFCGEPTQKGDVIARSLSRLTWWVSTHVTALPPLRDRWAKEPHEIEESSRAQALESVVDIHTFDPDSLARIAVRSGAVDVNTVTEELERELVLAGPYAHLKRRSNPEPLVGDGPTSHLEPGKKLEALDKNVLSKVVPDEFFYNVCITGCAP